jgi:hypothetical protein
MYNKELFEFISNGNIEKSLYNTCIFLVENSKIEILEDTLIYTCNYISSFVTIYNIAKFNDVIASTIAVINNNTINVIDYLRLISKMCILCDIYLKNPTTKSGTLPIPQLRQKIIHIFSNEIKLNPAGLAKFNSVMPPADSDMHDLVLKIITSFVNLFKIVESVNNPDDVYNISILLRDAFDYIIRKKYVIQTKFNLNEHDPIFFLWGFINSLFNHDHFIMNYYKLYCINNPSNNKTIRNQRTSLVHACAVAIIYNYKKSFYSSWNCSENLIIDKIGDVAINLFMQVKKEVGVEEEKTTETKKEFEHQEHKMDGLTYIFDYIPKMSNIINSGNTFIFEDEYKTIIKQ